METSFDVNAATKECGINIEKNINDTNTAFQDYFNALKSQNSLPNFENLIFLYLKTQQNEETLRLFWILCNSFTEIAGSAFLQKENLETIFNFLTEQQITNIDACNLLKTAFNYMELEHEHIYNPIEESLFLPDSILYNFSDSSSLDLLYQFILGTEDEELANDLIALYTYAIVNNVNEGGVEICNQFLEMTTREVTKRNLQLIRSFILEREKGIDLSIFGDKRHTDNNNYRTITIVIGEERRNLSVSNEINGFQLYFLVAVAFQIPVDSFTLTKNGEEVLFLDNQEESLFVITETGESSRELFTVANLPTHLLSENNIQFALIDIINDPSLYEQVVDVLNLLPDASLIERFIQNIDELMKLIIESNFDESLVYFVSIFDKILTVRPDIINYQIRNDFIRRTFKEDTISTNARIVAIETIIKFIDENFAETATQLYNVIFIYISAYNECNFRAACLKLVLQVIDKTGVLEGIVERIEQIFELLKSAEESEFISIVDILAHIPDAEVYKQIITGTIENASEIRNFNECSEYLFSKLFAGINDLSFAQEIITKNNQLINKSGSDDYNITVASRVLAGFLHTCDITTCRDFDISTSIIIEYFDATSDTLTFLSILSFINALNSYSNYTEVTNNFLERFCDQEIYSNLIQGYFEGASGLYNLGNTCYLNSILQQMFFTFPILSILVDSSELNPDIEALKGVFIELFSRNDSAVNPSNFIKLFNQETGGLFPENTPQDACEFFHIIVDRLPDFAKNVYTGETKTYFQDMSDRTISEVNEKFTTLNLVINGVSNLEESLAEFSKSHLLVGQNKYQESSGRLIDAKATTVIAKLPPVLVIQLERFEYDVGSGRRNKINSYFEFPEFFSFSGNNYFLKGIVMHSGASDFGHYFSHVKIEDHWLKLNDSFVSETTFPEIAQEAFGGSQYSPNAYILFYEASEQDLYEGIPLHFSFSNRLNIEVSDKGSTTIEKVLTSKEMINCIANSSLPIQKVVHFFLSVAIRSDNEELVENFASKIVTYAFSNMQSLIDILNEEAVFVLVAEVFANNSNKEMVLLLTKFLVRLIQTSSFEASKTFITNILMLLQNFTVTPERASPIFNFISLLYSEEASRLISETGVVSSTISFLTYVDQESDFSSALSMFAHLTEEQYTEPIFSLIANNLSIFNNNFVVDSAIQIFASFLKKELISSSDATEILGRTEDSEHLIQKLQYVLLQSVE